MLDRLIPYRQRFDSSFCAYYLTYSIKIRSFPVYWERSGKIFVDNLYFMCYIYPYKAIDALQKGEYRND